MQLFTEGDVKFYASKDEKGKISKDLETFYNPVMRFNRDASVLFLNAFCEINKKQGIQIADIMAGSGVRSLRFLKELDKRIIKSITINDYDKDFIETMKKNLALNNIHEENIVLQAKDANILLLESKGFDYIDIDPFGSPNDFLDSSIARISRDGILAVTATDTAPLCGTYPDACKRKYWAQPLNNHLMHEIGLRILIRKVQLIGTQYEKALFPIYSYSKDHYFRIFFVCEKGKSKCDEILKKHEFVLSCNNCLDFSISKYNIGKCPNCNIDYESAGPLWAGKLYDEKIAAHIMRSNTWQEDATFFETIHNESKEEFEFVGFHDIHALSKKYKFTIPNYDTLILKIRKSGFDAVRTHFSDYGIKSNIGVKELVKIICHDERK